MKSPKIRIRLYSSNGDYEDFGEYYTIREAEKDMETVKDLFPNVSACIIRINNYDNESEEMKR